MKKEVTAVGSTTPVADFKAMLSYKDKNLLVPAAKGLMQRIEDLVELYVNCCRLHKALDCTDSHSNMCG